MKGEGIKGLGKGGRNTAYSTNTLSLSPGAGSKNMTGARVPLTRPAPGQSAKIANNKNSQGGGGVQTGGLAEGSDDDDDASSSGPASSSVGSGVTEVVELAKSLTEFKEKVEKRNNDPTDPTINAHTAVVQKEGTWKMEEEKREERREERREDSYANENVDINSKGSSAVPISSGQFDDSDDDSMDGQGQPKQQGVGGSGSGGGAGGASGVPQAKKRGPRLPRVATLRPRSKDVKVGGTGAVDSTGAQTVTSQTVKDVAPPSTVAVAIKTFTMDF